MPLLSKWCEKIINISNCSADVKVLYNNKNKKNKQKKEKAKKKKKTQITETKRCMSIISICLF